MPGPEPSCTDRPASSSTCLQPIEATVFRSLDCQLDTSGRTPIAIAVSGGSDSLALLHLAQRWGAARNRPVIAATVDHGLRPEAAQEAEQVAQTCVSLGVPHTTLLWHAPENRSSNQSLARAGRHRLICEWAKRNGAFHILLGHTQDDALETFLIRARGGSGWFGLAGLAACSPSPAWPEGRKIELVRPLLVLRRQTIQDWLSANGHAWVNDPSNSMMKYERVRMRAVISKLDDPDRARFLRIINRMSILRQAEISAIRTRLHNEISVHDDGSITADRASFLTHSAQANSRLIGWLAMCAGGAPTAPRHATADRLEADIRTRSSGATTLGDAWCVWNAQTLSIYRRPPGESRTPGAPSRCDVSLAPGEHLIWDGRFELCLAPTSEGGQIITLDDALAQNLHVEGLNTLKPVSSSPARRSLPVLRMGSDIVIAPGFDASPPFVAKSLASERLFALVNEVAHTEIEWNSQN